MKIKDFEQIVGAGNGILIINKEDKTATPLLGIYEDKTLKAYKIGFGESDRKYIPKSQIEISVSSEEQGAWEFKIPAWLYHRIKEEIEDQ